MPTPRFPHRFQLNLGDLDRMALEYLREREPGTAIGEHLASDHK
ncbi:MAG: hypothetical protein V3S30_10045 [Thermoanaerobaculia bacterium]